MTQKQLDLDVDMHICMHDKFARTPGVLDMCVQFNGKHAHEWSYKIAPGLLGYVLKRGFILHLCASLNVVQDPHKNS